jgi:hypothetical protein
MHVMDKEEYKRRQEEIARHAESEGAWYYDPDNSVIWKRYIIGPVPRWRRVLWWFFPPSHQKMCRIMQRRSDRMWKDATDHLTGSKTPTARATVRVVFLSMAGPVILSAVGPLYYGYTHSPYWRIIVWALASTVGFLWLERSSFKRAVSTAPPSILGRSLLVVTIVAVVIIAFVVGDSLLYLLARSLHPH